jgi:Cu(I)/Ag(I) efflux system membrane fusion protein
MKNKYALIILGIIIGIGLMSLWNHFNNDLSKATKQSTSKVKTPKYWVAPMDPNYKRDQPGKSPMGMDLIPVFEEPQSENKPSVGTISITPQVVNNLGVKTAKVEMSPLHTEINTVGYIQFDQDQLVHINPRVEGWIEKLYVKSTGDSIENGQALYEIYSPSLVNAQEELILALKRDNNTLINAAKERLKSLQLPESAINYVVKNRTVKQNVTFFAPQAGVVDDLLIRQGMFVKPGNMIMSIGKLDQVWVEAEVFERQSSIVKIDSPVTMTTDFHPGKMWRGKVDYIYPTLDPKTRTLKVRLRFENTNQLLKPNMFSQVSIHSNSDESYLLVPRQAVIRTGIIDRVVLSLGNGQFKSIEVKVGQSDDTFIQILQGLNAGDEIVVSAQFLIDSESSKTSDFSRINQSDTSKQTATVTGVINAINTTDRILNISRGAIEKWNRAPATLDFGTTSNIDISRMKVGMKIEFSFYIANGTFIITETNQVAEIN